MQQADAANKTHGTEQANQGPNEHASMHLCSAANLCSLAI